MLGSYSNWIWQVKQSAPAGQRTCHAVMGKAVVAGPLGSAIVYARALPHKGNSGYGVGDVLFAVEIHARGVVYRLASVRIRGLCRTDADCARHGRRACAGHPGNSSRGVPSRSLCIIVPDKSASLGPAEALAAIEEPATGALPPSATARSLPNRPFWFLFDVPPVQPGHPTVVEFPSRHAQTLACWNAATLAPLGQRRSPWHERRAQPRSRRVSRCRSCRAEPVTGPVPRHIFGSRVPECARAGMARRCAIRRSTSRKTRR